MSDERTPLIDAADELYGSARQDFTARRSDLAKHARKDGDATRAKAIGKLPKPTPAAWVVDALVRHRFDDVARLLDLGAQLREAQLALAGDELRTLAGRQHRAVTAVADAGRALGADAGDEVSDATYQQVVQTLYAAMADAGAASAVASGRLTRHLASVGFDAVDLSGAVALPDAVVAYEPRPVEPVEAPPDPGVRSTAASRSGSAASREPARPDRRVEPSGEQRAQQRAALANARRRVSDAEVAARAASDTRARSAHALEDSRQRLQVLDDRRAALQAELHAVENDHEEARRAARAARDEEAEAVRAVGRAETAAARARAELERLQP